MEVRVIMRAADEEPEVSGGDPVCWLSQVCPECGLLVEEALPAVCGRCGATVTPEEVP